MEQKMKEFVEQAGKIMTPSPDQAKKTIDNIRKKVREYVHESGLKSLVVGISGGLDSAVVAAICQEEFTGVPLIGVSIPMSIRKWQNGLEKSIVMHFRKLQAGRKHMDQMFPLLKW